MINPYADIDDGYEVFDDDQQRRTAEARFLNQCFHISIPGGSFEVTRLTTIHLIGQARPGRYDISHPFDFEEGYLEAWGIEYQVGVPRRTIKANLRWSDYGRNPALLTVCS